MNSLRREILEKIPDLDINRSHPFQVLWFVGFAPAIVALSVLTVTSDSWPLKLLFSLGLGFCYPILGLFGHELLHGTIIKPRTVFSRVVIRLMAWFSFVELGLSPEVWMTWHNRIHHYQTNQSAVDPDSFGFWSDFEKLPMVEFLKNRAPGSKHWLSWVYLPLNFNNQVLSIWYLIGKNPEAYKSMNKRLAVVETALQYLFWGVIAAKVGFVNLIYVFLIPMLIANLVLSSYILVQHLLCPLATERGRNDPLENTLGVVMLPLFDTLHLHFGYHIEHHIFPELNHTQFPRIREFLKKEYPARYRCTGHVNALRTLMGTPRVYQDATTLYDRDSKRSFDVSKFGIPAAR